jgi:EAL domain-containing protein (putative c-di-GMP-specific phosphodiesterase class I)
MRPTTEPYVPNYSGLERTAPDIATGDQHIAGPGGTQRLRDQSLADADQAASLDDQLSSDADDLAASVDENASRVEQERADLEQRASDADQAAADHEATAAGPMSPRQVTIHAEARAIREDASADRRRIAISRAATDGARTEQSIERSRISGERDTASDVRDATAELRDQASALAERGLPTTRNERAQLHDNAISRGQAAAARTAAAEDRRDAAAARACELVAAATVAIDLARAADFAVEAELSTSLPASERADELRTLLPGALRRGELSLHFQPLYALDATLSISGFEALLRWQSPVLGHVGPDEFIPVAEAEGLIVEIGEFVLGAALETVAHWRRAPGREALSIAVNVAPEQLVAPDFVETTQHLLEMTGIPASALTLEITERTLVTDEPALHSVMVQLRELGIQLSVDDFGTGFSSLGRLCTFPLDELKIDRIFVAALGDEPRQRALVAGIVAMSTALGLRVVAEGIETPAQHESLVALGCTHGQGYLLGRPLDGAQTAALLGGSAQPPQGLPPHGLALIGAPPRE